MSISGALDRVWRLTPFQRMLIAAVAVAALADAVGPSRDVLSLVVRACLWFAMAALLERTFEAVRGAPLDGRVFIAYLPLACASLAFFLAKVTAASVTRSGSLEGFFQAANGLLGLLLVSLVVEARRAATHDRWLRALRGWWVGFVIIGMLYSLLGLLPDSSRQSQKEAYAIAWMGLVGAVVALAVVMWKDPSRQSGEAAARLEVEDRQEPTSANGLSTGTRTSTRTPVRSSLALHRADRR